MTVYAKTSIIVCLLQFSISSLFSQNFTLNNAISVENFSSGDLKWVDYDSDYDLDIYISGNSQSSLEETVIYNNNAGVFSSRSNIGLEPLRRSASAWGDLNNDGFIDIVRLGIQGGDQNSNGFSLISFNNGDGTFTEQNLPDDEIFTSGHMELADFDNDGDLDIYITGLNSSLKSVSAFYRNENDNNFTRLSGTSVVGVTRGNVESGDYDLDGDIDLLISGENRLTNSSSSNIIKVLKNNGDWGFTEVDINIGKDPFEPYATWGDINNDGYLDILANGRVLDDNYSVALLQGSATGFDLVNDSNLPKLGFAINQGFLDYNNDGLLDVLLSGSFEGSNDIRLYKNNGDNSFSLTVESFSPSNVASFDCADYDSDGDLDLIIVGRTEGFNSLTTVYDNSITQSNTSPTMPSGLSASVDGRSVLLSWSNASDTESPLEALSYNVRVGTSSNGIEIMAPSANVTTGFNYLNKAGNTGNNAFYGLNNLPNGTYYFSVQSVDLSGGYSDFTDEIIFEINSTDNSVNQPANLTGEYLNTDKVSLVWNDLAYNETSYVIERAIGTESFEIVANLPANTVDYIDEDVSNNLNYNYRVKAIGVSENSQYSNVFSINTPAKGFFSKIDTVRIVDEVNNSTGVNLVDYNNDGLTDVLILNYLRKSSLFKNIGENNFIKIEGNALVDLEIQARSATWGDIDNDNLPDVLVTTSSSNYLFHNNGNDTFSHLGPGNLGSESGDSNGAAWGDVNNDGFIDCYFSNVIANGELYINNQNNTFSPLESGDIVNRDEGGIDASFIDVNADMLIDLFVSVYFETNSLYLNEEGDLILDEDSNLSLSAGSPSVGASWSDYDNDGDFDVLITNNVNTNDEFYENDGLGNFTQVNNLITDSYIQGSGSSWLDFDNDGWEDVIIVTDNSKVLFRNLGNREFEMVDEYAFSDTQYSASVATGDLNNDGFEDIVVANSMRNEYFLNNTNENNWIKVKAKGTINNKNAIGAKVKVITPDLEMTKPIMTNSGNDSQSPFIKQFGLAQSVEAEVQVYWPNNGIQIIDGANANETHELVEVELPHAPTGLSELNLAYNQIELSWFDNAADELGFIIYRKSESSPRFERYDTVAVNTTSYTDVNVEPVSTYTYFVSAYIAEGTSFQTNTLKLTTPVAPPVAPTNLEINTTDNGILQLTWQDNSDNEDNITLERSVGNDTSFEELIILNANTQNFDDSEVQKGQTYYYRVFASNMSGDSDYSNVASDSPVTSLLNQMETEINIFPNPTSTKLFLNGNLNNYNYRIIELSGKNVQSGKVTNEKYINVSGLNFGSYILELYQGDIKFQHRLLIHK